MQKRLLSVLLSLCFVLSLIPMAAAAETVVPDYSWYDSSATSYSISDVADLVGLANLVNGTDNQTQTNFSGKTINLGATIDCGGAELTPIGNTSEANNSGAFRGTFNGNNYVIKNATIASAENMGIFGLVYNGTIKNLTVESVTISNAQTGSEPAAGIIAGSIRNSTVENITVSSSCSVNADMRAGGIVGSSRGANSVLRMCVNHAPVTGTKYTGGIVGAAHELNYSSSGTEMTDCDNYGEVNGVNEVGGIVGYADRAQLTDCDNHGTVTGTGNYGTGGILGFDAFNEGFLSFLDPTSGSTLNNCDNFADITGLRTGGIVGTFGSAPGDNQADDPIYCNIINCDNSGDIVGTVGKCGSIFGYQISYRYGDGESYINNLQANIQSCGNTGLLNGEQVGTTQLSGSPFAVIS